MPGEGPRARTTRPLSFSACAAKAESDAQEANACLTATPAAPERYDAHCRDLLSPPDDWLAVEPELSVLRCELPDEHCSILEFVSRDASFRPSAETARSLAGLGARLIQ